jgi:hypothetical protein
MDKTTAYVLVGGLVLVGLYVVLTRTDQGNQLAASLGLQAYLPKGSGVAAAGIQAGSTVASKGFDYLIARDKNETALEIAKLENASSDAEDE